MVSEKDRPSWDEYFMLNALLISTRASCLHLKNGAVIVNKDKRIIAAGYNGAPSGIKNCLEVGCNKNKFGVSFEEKGKGLCRGNHAEYNALSQVGRDELKGTSIYTLYYPCSACAKQIIGSGIRRVVYANEYEEQNSIVKQLFREAGMERIIPGIDSDNRGYLPNELPETEGVFKLRLNKERLLSIINYALLKI